MSILVGSQDRSGWEMPQANALDEAVWQAWLEKGAKQDHRGSAVRLKAVKLGSIAGLLAAAGLWSNLAAYDVVARIIVAGGATVVMFAALQTRRYAAAAVFGALVLLYNPVVPVFSFSGDWQRVLVVASAAPFAASLAWRKVTKDRNDRA